MLKGAKNWIKELLIYSKYQLLTKFILLFILFPLYGYILKKLLKSTGRVIISSGDFINFFTRPESILFSILTILLIFIIVAIDINSFIILSSKIKENKKNIKILRILGESILTIRKFINPLGFLMMFYIVSFFPILGIGSILNPIQSFRLPNFILSVIYDNIIYFSIYLLLIIILSYVSIRYIFTFHYIVLEDVKPFSALKKSSILFKKNWKDILNNLVLRTFGKYIFLLAFLSFLLEVILTINTKFRGLFRFSLFLFLFYVFEIIIFILFTFIPYIISVLTKLFYKYENVKNTNDSSAIFSIQRRFIIRLLILILFFNIVLAFIFSNNFINYFTPNIDIEIVAHRGGGYLAAENTIQGIQKSIDENIPWTEIDVQRTMDGHYIINHDKNFYRVARDKRKSEDMLLEDIKKLRVINHFNRKGFSQPVATLEESLKISKDKIKLFIELKGKTADKQMVDDIVNLVDKYKMRNQVVLISLNYSIIKYIEDKYNDIDSGYIYFFSFGKISELVSDYLIMEEQEATIENINNAHIANKKVYVWTINTEESMNKFLNTKIDGIITDDIRLLKEKKRKVKYKTDLEIIFNNIID